MAAEPALVDIKGVAPVVKVDARYAGSDNFVGAVVDGYHSNKCLLTEQAAAALAAAQQEFADFGLQLVIYDCFRPQRAVDHFLRWTRDEADTKTRAQYYPGIPKSELVPLGYIAEQSGHSRGSTVDLSLQTEAGDLLDMGSPWDFFDPLSNTENPSIPAQAKANRLLLRAVMAQHGFANYPAEWWHFTLVDEPNTDEYWDQPVR
ncbi:peptidase M15 [Halioglobus maricola]|uniref:D-alanyl-D-alanine dipeptidase n=2 Tax=Halioglobus maricola TaxID=2601894 RepID=A0A5P9NPL1_9GAMM|nr:peptidase M15 [Halioglobus maricola]